MEITLIRDTDSGKSTIGRMYCCDEFLCRTLENSWKNNERMISCIPEGMYEMELKEYGRFYEEYKHPIIMLKDVPKRSEILIHIGNYPKDTHGCILLGDSVGKDAVWNSRKTYNNLYPLISQATTIEIINKIK